MTIKRLRSRSGNASRYSLKCCRHGIVGEIMFAVSVLTPRLPAAYQAASAVNSNVTMAVRRGRATTALAHAASHAPKCCATLLTPRRQRRGARAEHAWRRQCACETVEDAARDAVARAHVRERAPLPRIDYRTKHGRRARASVLVEPVLRAGG